MVNVAIVAQFGAVISSACVSRYVSPPMTASTVSVTMVMGLRAPSGARATGTGPDGTIPAAYL
jgi:hypothetical protein